MDLKVHGCPFPKEELEKVVLHLALGKAIESPCPPVCFECKANGNLCLFDLGELCLGPVTRGGCDSWCPNSRFGCWGCRGPADDANLESLRAIAKEHGFPERDLAERLECFGGFAPREAPEPPSRRKSRKGGGKDYTAYVIEVNPNPDISDDAGFARSVRAYGLTFEQIITKIVEYALERMP